MNKSLIASALIILCHLGADEIDDFLGNYHEEWNPYKTSQIERNQTGKTLTIEDLKQIAQNEEFPDDLAQDEAGKTILINFNNVAITEFIRFISRISNTNFVYDEADLQFNVTIVSEEPATMTNVMAALLQVLRIHDLYLIEQGNNIVIHRNPAVSGISKVVADGVTTPAELAERSEIVTRVFRLNTLDTERAAKLIQPLISEVAIVEGIKETSTMVVTDLSVNVEKIDKLLKGLDSPASGLIIGQYQVTSALIDSILPLAEQIMNPIADGKPLVFTPHITSNSIFIVSTPFLVERAIAVLRNLDVDSGATRIFTNESLKFEAIQTPVTPPGGFPPGFEQIPPGQLPEGHTMGPEGQIYGPDGRPLYGPDGRPLNGPEGIRHLYGADGAPFGHIGPRAPFGQGLPYGHIQRTQFYIQKLKFRKGDQIVLALGRIGDSLSRTGQSNADIVATINSLQWIESTNSLVFTGVAEAILKVRELINEIDTPLRQVFIEMLILETSLADSLTYGVNWGSRFFNGYTSGSQAFISNANPLAGALDTGDPIRNFDGFPDASVLSRTDGYTLGIIGRTLTSNGVEFASIGALVKAVHTKSKGKIIMNPKILAEDGVTATIFVGFNTRFQTQSISNDQGNIVTNNFEFRDVGTTLSITPMISSNDIVTLEIQEEVSRIVPESDVGGGGLANIPAGPSTSKNTTTTRVHVPNKFFLVLSGMIQDERNRNRSQVPCLGGAPFIGAAFSQKTQDHTKQNLMIFIRPEIIDTDEDIQNLTRHQQNLYRHKERTTKMWQLETDEALDWMNIKSPDNTYRDREQYNP